MKTSFYNIGKLREELVYDLKFNFPTEFTDWNVLSKFPNFQILVSCLFSTYCSSKQV